MLKVVLLVLVAISLALVAQAIWQHFNPPFTDAQIADVGIVDTWEPHAIVVAFLLVLLTLLACGVGVMLVFGGPQLRRYSACALAAIVAAAISQLAAHIELTHQATRATGQTFGGLFGLF